jgi:hypothetical protein
MERAQMRINKTVGNLKRLWHLLDDASGSLYNVVDQLGNMTDMPELQDQLDKIDITAIDSIKEQIESILEEKGVDLDEPDHNNL